MTIPYSVNQLPYKVDIKCPSCRQRAQFEFAAIQRIRNKEDVEYFKNNQSFEYKRFQDSCGHYWHGAIYYEGLHGHPLSAIHELPTGYDAAYWSHSKSAYTSKELNIGSVNCNFCSIRRKHSLQWPEEAYFQISYKNHILWAYNTESTNELNDYLISKSRDRSKYNWRYFLMHIPTVFKTQKAREPISKQLSKFQK